MTASTLLVLDAQISHAESLLAAVLPSIPVVILSPSRDGITQISQALQAYPGIRSLHLVSHGAPGCLYLGNSSLSLENLTQQGAELRRWFQGIPQPQIFLYGCQVAAGDAGAEFIEKLRILTQAAVAASTSLTGAASLGGNWNLELQLGDIAMESVFSANELNNYAGVLDAPGSLFIYAESSVAYTALLDPLQLLVQERLTDWFGQEDYLTQLAIPFSATASSESWTANAEALRQLILGGDYSIRLEVRSGEELEGAFGAYSATGTTNQPTIYLNGNWLTTASTDQIQAVLLEELGHSFDQILNNGADSPGDEGEIFANLVLNTGASTASLLQQNDHQIVTIGGQQVKIEAAAWGPSNVAQTFYLPMAEDQVRTSLFKISSSVGNDIRTVISLVSTSNGTVIVYDHWEDGYEADINNPTQATTQIWGDGNLSNGVAPGDADDVLASGQVITLINTINIGNLAAVDFDGRDRIGATKAIAVTKAGWATNPGTVLAGAINIYDVGNSGKEYIIPIGQNTVTNNANPGDTANRLFEYTSLHIIAYENGTTVNIDLNGDGDTSDANEVSVTLAQGQSYLVNGNVLAGTKVTSNKAIGVYSIAGDIGSSYENRWLAITPTEQWFSSYYAPVATTRADAPAHVFLYNPGNTAITVTYDTQTTQGATISVPAKGNAYVVMPASAAHFYTVGGEKFFAISTIDSDATSNQSYDWSYSLVPESYLTDKFVVAWGPGYNNTDGAIPTAKNGSPVWVTAPKDTTIYIDYNGDGTVDATYNLKALESYRIRDNADKDQSGLTVYTTDGTLITAAWGEDPSVADAGNPYLDMGTTVLPFPDYVFKKASKEASTAVYGAGVSDNDNLVELTEQIEYTVSVTNRAVIDLFNINIKDSIAPSDSATYVPNSTSFTIYDPNGNIVVSVLDLDGASNNFPLSGAGYTITDADPNTPGIQGLQRGYQAVIKYRVQVRADINQNLSDADYVITNNAQLTGNPADGDPITKTVENETQVIVNSYDGEVAFYKSDFSAIATSFQEGDTIGIQVTDRDPNKTSTTAETLTVTVTNITTGETEVVTLTETGVNTGIFRGTLATSITSSNNGNNSGTLYMVQADSLKVEYTDPVFGTAFDNPTKPGIPQSSNNTANPLLPSPGNNSDADTSTATGKPNTANATVAVPSKTKILYLSADAADNDGTGDLDRINPADPDSNPSTSDPDTSTSSTTNITPAIAATGGGTGTYRDNFSTAAYNNSDGTESWTTSWTEVGTNTDTNAGSGIIKINTSAPAGLAFERSGSTNPVDADVQRSLNLSSADTSQAITLSFTVTTLDSLGYSGINNDNSTESVTLRISTDGGTTFNAITTGSFTKTSGSTTSAVHSNGVFKGDSNGTGSYTVDIKSLIASATNKNNIIVRFDGTNLSRTNASDPLFAVDDFQISFTKTGTPATPAVPATFTQAINMADAFAMPTGGQISVVTYVSNVTGNPNGSANITANLTYGAGNTVIANLSNPVYNSGAGTLTWTGTLASAVNIPSGNAVKLVINNNQSGVSFKVDYDSNTKPSRIELPTTTVIDIKDVDNNAGNGIQEIGFYDNSLANGGSLITAGTVNAGQIVYLRVRVSDPFGDYDITGLTVTIDGPGATGDQTVTLTNANVINASGDGVAIKTYEYAWQTVFNTGIYDIKVVAKEGSEGITTSATSSLIVTSTDTGTPSVTTFITALGGIDAGPNYAQGANAFLRVTDLDENSNPSVQETVTAIVNGTSFTLTETGPNTGIFEAALTGPGFTNLPQGAVLSASYVDNDDATDTSTDVISVPVPGNQAPDAVNDSFSTNEDTQSAVLNLLANDTDVDGNPLSITNIAGTVLTPGTAQNIAVTNGTVNVSAGGQITFTPAANYNGPVSFDYTISDGNGGTDTATVNGTINAVNDAPDAVNDSFSTNEDTQSAVLNLLANDTDVDGNPLSITNIAGTVLTPGTAQNIAVTNGTVNVSAGGQITFTPAANYNGPVSFDYTISDGNGGTDTATVNGTINAVNDAPDAVNDSFSTNEDTQSAVLNLLANDTDVDGNPLSITNIAGTALTPGTAQNIAVTNGTVNVSAGGQITFTPAANYNGPVSFDYTISDGNGGTDTATVNGTINAVNDAPDAVNDSFSTNEDTQSAVLNLLANDTDVDGNPLSITNIAGTVLTPGTAQNIAVTNGTVNVSAGGQITFTPAANYNGPVSFDYTISDGNGGTDTATVNGTINAVNDAPDAVNDSFSTNEDTQSAVLNLLANDTDVDGNPLSITNIAGTVLTPGTAQNIAVTNGTVNVSAGGQITFTPAANYNGPVSFDYTISDGNGGTDTATVNGTINAVNDAPDAVNDSFSTNEDTQSAVLNLLANDTDVDGNPLSITNIAGTVLTPGTAQNIAVTNGTVNVSAGGQITFTPAANYNGPVSFDYTISDGNGGTDTATVNGTINAVNDAPDAVNDSFSTNEDTQSAVLNLLANDTDVDGNPLSITNIAGTVLTPGTAQNIAVTNGTVNVSAGGQITFTPAANYNGPVSFDYTISDGNGGTDTATVNGTINAVNDAPDAVNDSFSTNEDTQSAVLNLLANDTDVDGNPLSITNIAGTALTPGTAQNIAVTNGTVNVSAGGQITFTPAANYNGPVSFDYTISDGNGGTDTATVNGTINAVNDAPDAVNDSFSTNEDTQSAVLNLLANDTDVDGNPLSITNIAGTVLTPGTAQNIAVTNGTVNVSAGGQITFTPAANYNGPVSFDYTISDGNGGTDTATVNGTINAVNDAPDAVNDSFSTNEDTQSAVLNLLANDTDVDGNPLSITNIAGTVLTPGTAQNIAVTNGTVNVSAGGQITFTPAANYNGPVSFDYTISDGNGGTDTATVNGTINAVNDAPDAVNDSFSTNEDTQSAVLNLLANDTDVDGNPLSITNIAGTVLTPGTAQNIAVTNGTVNVSAGGQITFTPAANYNGPVSFDYTISDGNGGTDTATVNGTINAVNDAPDAVNDSFSTNEDTQSAVLNLLANDTDVDGNPLSITNIAGTALTPGTAQNIAVTNGTVNVSAGGQITFTPAANYNGPVSFDYTISDGNGGTDTATVNGTINAVNDAPDAVNDSFSTNEDTQSAVLNLLANDTDVDGNPLSITNIAGTALTPGTAQNIAVTNGTVNVSAGGQITFTPAANYNGPVSFDYTISDGNGGTDTATVNGTINAVNDAPDAVNDSFSTNEDTQSAVLNLLANDTDVDGNPLSITNIAGTVLTPGTAQNIAVTNGTVNVSAGGQITFTPAANYNGPVSFDYTISDGNGGTDTATVNGTINAVNDAPDAVNDSFSTNEDTQSAVLNLLANDTDVDGNPLSITNIAGTVLTPGTAQNIAVTNGTVNVSAGGQITFTPAANYNGPVSFDYTISDGNGGTDTATVNGTINAVNDAPVLDLDANNSSGASGADYVTAFTPGVPVAIGDSDLTITDVDSSNIVSATITLTNAQAGDVLNTPTIAGLSFNTDTSVAGQIKVTVTGSKTLDEYEAAIKAITFSNSSNNSDTTARTITVVVNDGDQDSNIATTTISTLNINSLTVNEGSPYAVFTVTGSSGQSVFLSTTGGTATKETDGILGNGEDFGNGLEYFDGTSWVAYTGTAVTFPSGGTTLLVRTPITNDSPFEGPETFTLSAISSTGGSSATGTGTIVDDGTGTIFNDNGTPNNTAPKDDDRPSFSINDVTVNEAAGTATFTVTKTGTTTESATVNFGTSNGSATSGQDYTTNSGTLTFAANETSKTVTVNITNDGIFEGSETFNVNLSNATNATIADGTGVGTIKDDGTVSGPGPIPADDDRPSFSINDVTVNEAAGTATFTVTKTGTTTQSATVNFGTSNGSATSGQDYTTNSGTLTFAANETSKTVTVNITNDGIFEGSETFNVNLSNATNATIADGTGVGTIKDDGTVTGPGSIPADDDRPSFSINDVTVNEAAGTATFTVTKTGTTTQSATVNFGTSNGSATSGQDYTGTTGTLTFAANETSKTVTVNITNDGIFEGSETFNVNLSNATNATIADGTGVGTIKDDGTVSGPGPIPADDDRPSFSINDVTVNEAAGTATFTVTKTGTTTQSATVNFGTSNGSATSGQDYTGTNGTLTFAANETSKTVTVNITNDGIFEGSETFNVNLSNATNATIADGTGVGTIKDDGTVSGPGPIPADDDRPSFSINDVTVNEAAGTATFTVTKTGTTTQSATVNFGTSNGSATSGQDYTGTTGTLTFAANETSKTITVNIINDGTYEGSETFNVNLSNATNATIAGGTGVGTIKDDGTVSGPGPIPADDDRPLNVSSPVVTEGTNPFAIFEIQGVAGQTLSLTLGNTSDGENTATQGLDYASSTPALQYSIDGGQTWQAYSGGNITIPGVSGSTNAFLVRTVIVDDTVAAEGNETFTLKATYTSGASKSATGTGTIQDNDSLNVNVIALTPVNEASTYALFTVNGSIGETLDLSLGNTTTGTDQDASINGFVMEYSSDGTNWIAYSAASKPIVPASGTIYVRVNISSEQDSPYEGAETFTLKADITRAPGASDTDIATIVDDGTGNKYTGNIIGGNPTTDPTTKDDDRILTINDVTVNEASPYAVFTVTGISGQTISLASNGDSASKGIDFGDALEYSLNNGITWNNYSTPVTLAGTTMLVRSAINNDTSYEGAETFTLTATYTSGGVKNATGTGTIIDDGTGIIFNPNGSPDNTTPKDDDRPRISINTIAGDDIINALEASSPIAVSGTTSGVEDGQTVTVIIDGNIYTTTVSSNVWTLDVPVADIANFEASEIVTANVSDLAGNPAPQANRNIIIDTAAPNVAITSITDDSGNAGDFVTNDQTLVIAGTWTNLPTNTLAVTFNGITYTLGIAPQLTVSGNNWTLDLTGVTTSPGNYVVTAKATDLANNTAQTSQNITIDTTAPTLDITGPTDPLGPGESRTITFTFSEVPVGFDSNDITVTGGNLSNLTPTANPLIFTAIFTQSGTGEPSISVANNRYSDEAGNLGTGDSLTLGIDATPPDIRITLAADITADDIINGAEASQSIPITGTVEGEFNPGDTVILTINGQTFTGPVGNDGSFSINVPGSTLAADPDRTIEASITSTDGVGNSTTATDTETYSVDTTAPGAPTVTITEDTNNDGILNGDELSGNVDVKIDLPADALVGDKLTVTDGSIPREIILTAQQITDKFVTTSFVPPADGSSLTVTAFLTDRAGNTGPASNDSATLDLTGPETGDLDITDATDTGADDLLTANGNPQLTFVGEPGLTISLLGPNEEPLESNQFSVSYDPVTGLYTVTLLDADLAQSGNQPFGTFDNQGPTNNPPNAVDGFYTILATDTAGNEADVGQFEIETSPPPPPPPVSVTVTSPTVNEASPYAVFTVDGALGQLVSLSLTNGTAGSSDYGNGLEYSADGGATWTSYTGGGIPLNGAGGTLLVRTPITNDTIYEGAETFTLTATPTGGTAAIGTGTIVDDGTGIIFNPDGSPNSTAPKDDDFIQALPDYKFIDQNTDKPYLINALANDAGNQISILSYEQPRLGTVTKVPMAPSLGVEGNNSNSEQFLYTPALVGDDPEFIGSEFVNQLITEVTQGVFRLSTTGINNLPGAIPQLKFTLKNSKGEFTNELFVFKVDDASGSINGLQPGQAGYLAAALQSSRVIFSALANNRLLETSRILDDFSATDLVGFALVQNSSLEDVLAALETGTTPANVFLSIAKGNPDGINHVQRSGISTNQFTLSFEDQLNGGDRDYNDVVIQVEANNDSMRLGTEIQGSPENEVIDLRQSTLPITAFFNISGNSIARNQLGFYRVENEQGSIRNPVTGALVNPGDANYTQLALQISNSLGLSSVQNLRSANLAPGFLYAPYITTVGENSSNTYFPYRLANSDGIDHVRLLGDNTFGFEDTEGGGDKDYEDLVVQANLEMETSRGVFQLRQIQPYTDTFNYTITNASGLTAETTVTIDVQDTLISNLKVTLLNNNAGFNNEVIFFKVEDDAGTINGLKPGDAGYLETALARSRVIFSAINGATSPFNEPLTRIFEDFTPTDRLSFALIQNSTLDDALDGLSLGQALPNIFWSLETANKDGINHANLTAFSPSSFTLSFEDLAGGGDLDYNDINLKVEATSEVIPFGANLQGGQQGEILDLRSTASLQALDSTEILLGFQVKTAASNLNSVGLYLVQDAEGTILDANGNRLTPGNPNYAAEAIRQRVPLISNGLPIGTTIAKEGIYAPFLITKGTESDFLAKNPQNLAQTDTPIAYFPFIEANPDQLDHLRLLADNTFSFEDQLGGGDQDDNDVIVKVNQTPLNNELLDLSSFSGQVQASFTNIVSNAQFLNSVGFYRVADQLGTVIDPLTNRALTPNDLGYAEASLRNAIPGLVINKNTSPSTINLPGGSLFAPYLIVDTGTGLPTTYFSYLGANPDKADHMIFSEDNKLFRFEDSFGGGDIDFNDLQFRVNLSPL
ncbi:Ig-like domain-containing protein [Synechocystis sp. LKSZ1]|uniref:Ig-like domain-containing protein n=1 Tax=Synechocystis sp. LKSZ1 TaxID=3144951 RepID=UPI00336BCEBB